MRCAIAFFQFLLGHISCHVVIRYWPTNISATRKKEQMIDPEYIKADGDEFEVRMFQNERYRFFKGWTRPHEDSTDPSYISYAFGPSTVFESLESIRCPPGWMWTPDSSWAVDLNYTKTNSLGWSYATSFERMHKKYSENISSSSPTLRQVTRRRLWSRLIQKELSPLDGFDGM
jgi:hypothetical protein